MMKKRRSKEVRGLSLTELLVVIAIIAILGGIIIPVTAGVRKNLRTVQAASNLRQWGVYLAVYGLDNGGRRPCATFTNSQGSKVWMWKDQLIPYVDKPLRLELMSDPNLPSEARSRMYNTDTTFSSVYAMNPRVVDLRERPTYLWNPLGLASPANFIELADGRWVDAWRTCGETFSHNPDGPQNSTIDFRQSGNGANVLFADGHVRTMKREEITHSMLNVDGLNQ